ncbi:MAG: hypothetical protein QXK37_06225 [Candidatus Woesearchaeota archaeon]
MEKCWFKRIDLHYHTIESDGQDTIKDSYDKILEYEIVPALVVTNHLNSKYRASYQKTRDNAEKIRLQENKPIIIGLELALKPEVLDTEILVFGTSLCEEIDRQYEKINSCGYRMLVDLKNEFKGAYIQCHPKTTGEIDIRLAMALNGVEITVGSFLHPHYNSILKWLKDLSRPEINYRIWPYANSDGHAILPDPLLSLKDSGGFLGQSYNYFEQDIRSERELIDAITTSPPVRRFRINKQDFVFDDQKFLLYPVKSKRKSREYVQYVSDLKKKEKWFFA